MYNGLYFYQSYMYKDSSDVLGRFSKDVELSDEAHMLSLLQHHQKLYEE
jgi:hypothetical protein